MHPNDIAKDVLDAAVAVQRELGIGLREKVYERALAVELRVRGHRVDSQVRFDARYRDVSLGLACVLDLLVDARVVVEVKSIERLTLVHRAQLLTQLKVAEKPLGLVLNFGSLVGRSVFRAVNGLDELAEALAALDGQPRLR